MIKRLLIPLLFCATLSAAPKMDFSVGEDLVVNNRILLKVKGTPITVLDVARKMDLIFYRQYPELAQSAQARFQFYQTAWSQLLAAVVDDQLILADAEEKQITVSDGEVREELERLFGPNVVLNLNKTGLTLAEAFSLIKGELTVNRMTAMMVHNKAFSEVHPKMVRQLYQEKLAANPPSDQWVYQVLSIRGDTHAEHAQEVYEILQKSEQPFEVVIAALRNRDDLEFKLSEVYARKEADLSIAHRGVLQSLNAGSYSAPVIKKEVSRLFCLHKIEKGEAPNFNDVAEDLRGELIQEAIARHNVDYRQKLRVRYGLTEKYLAEALPEENAPFALR